MPNAISSGFRRSLLRRPGLIWERKRRRVTELVKGMPLTRGLVMACLFASFGLATVQPKEDTNEKANVAFFLYVLIIHIIAIQTIGAGSIRSCVVHAAT